MKLFVIFLFLVLCVGHCKAWCTAQNTGGAFDCYYNGHRIPLSQTRTFGYPECVRCTCSPQFLSCCSIGIDIREIAPECEILRNGCYQRAVLKTDHNKPCPFVSAVGR